jgi:putative lipase involved disintegration of autophagic bodies
MKNIVNELIAERSAIKSRMGLGLYELERKKVYDTIMYRACSELLMYHYKMMTEAAEGKHVDRESVLATMAQAYEEFKSSALELSDGVKLLKIGAQTSLFESHN